MWKLFKKKKPVYFDLDSYDCSSFAREVTEEELYLINGGGTMSSADQAAMAEAGKNGDAQKQAEIRAKYETKDSTSTSTSTGSNGLVKPAPATVSTTPTQVDTPAQSTALDHGQQAEMAKQDAERKTGGAGSGGSYGSNSSSAYSGGGYSGQGGSASGSGSSSKGSSGSKSYTSALTHEQQYEMGIKGAEERKSADRVSGSTCGAKEDPSGAIKGHEAALTHKQQHEMAMKYSQKNGNNKNGIEYGVQAGYVADLDGAFGMGHAGWFAQRDGKYAFFEVIGISDKDNGNGISEKIQSGTKTKDKWGNDVTVLSNSPLSFPTAGSAGSSNLATNAGCLLRFFDSKDEMKKMLNEIGFDEMVVFNKNSVQNDCIYDASIKNGIDFKGYNLLNNSCGIIARDSLITDGSGISTMNPYYSIKHPFSRSIPNDIWANLFFANEGSYLETLRQ